MEVDGVDEVVGCIGVSWVEDVFSFEDVSEMEVVMGVGRKEWVGESLVVRVEVGGGGSECGVMGISVVRGEREVENV